MDSYRERRRKEGTIWDEPHYDPEEPRGRDNGAHIGPAGGK